LVNLWSRDVRFGEHCLALLDDIGFQLLELTVQEEFEVRVLDRRVHGHAETL
jgi:hypothetical protein